MNKPPNTGPKPYEPSEEEIAAKREEIKRKNLASGRGGGYSNGAGIREYPDHTFDAPTLQDDYD